MNTKYNKITVLDGAMDKLKKAPEIIQNLEIPQDIPHGDMPGDKVEIEEVHINKARTIFPLRASTAGWTRHFGGKPPQWFTGTAGIT